MRPVLQNFLYVAAIIKRYIKSPRRPVDMLKLLTSFTDRWRIKQRHHLFDVVHDNPVEKMFITVLQCNQIKVSLKVCRFLANVAKDSELLFSHAVYSGR